jgi:hypothetical protein
MERNRLLYGTGAGVALVVAIAFAAVGDGVETEAAGLRGAVVDHGHTGVWALLAVALAIAAATGRWHRVSNGLALAAGVLYAVFLAALLTA